MNFEIVNYIFVINTHFIGVIPVFFYFYNFLLIFSVCYIFNSCCEYNLVSYILQCNSVLAITSSVFFIKLLFSQLPVNMILTV